MTLHYQYSLACLYLLGSHRQVNGVTAHSEVLLSCQCVIHSSASVRFLQRFFHFYFHLCKQSYFTLIILVFIVYRPNQHMRMHKQEDKFLNWHNTQQQTRRREIASASRG